MSVVSDHDLSVYFNQRFYDLFLCACMAVRDQQPGGRVFNINGEFAELNCSPSTMDKTQGA